MALRLMDFVSENKVEEEKELFKGGPRVKETTGPNERPLFEILKDNRDKKDAEFHEKYKHRPPKALDDDETEFLESVEMHKRELERQRVQEDAEQIMSFQAALASRTIPVEEPRIFTSQQYDRQEAQTKNKRRPASRPLPISVKINPLPKKSKTEQIANVEEPRKTADEKCAGVPESEGDVKREKKSTVLPGAQLLGLVSYSDETDEDED